jgi:hypothetical protein
MPIDTDVQSFTEENSNITDCNTKITQLQPLVLNTALTSSDNNRIPVRRSGVWSIEGEEAYNGQIQDFGNISGDVILTMNGSSCLTAMTATIIGNTFITGFGANFLAGVVYTLFLKQNGTGGFSVRWPYGASILKSVGTNPDQMTEVSIIKLPSGKVFIKCEAFRNTTDIGAVIKEFELPTITYPDESIAPLQFTWVKSSAVSYGGILSGLFSDWEIADDSLYTNLLFSSYNNTVDLSSIQVVLNQSGTAYMRTRYGGSIGGTPVLSSWDEAVVELQLLGSGGDDYWDQTVLCLNANKYTSDIHKIVDDKGYFKFTSYGTVRPVSVGDKIAYRFNGAQDLLYTPDSIAFRPTTENFTLEFFFSADSVLGSTRFIFTKSISTGYTPLVISVKDNGKIECTFYMTNMSYFSLLSLSSLTVSQIYHVAIVRNGSSFKLFLDGVLQQEQTQDVTLFSDPSHPLCFGCSSDYLYRFIGYIYSFRITKNIARYGSNFSVDTDKPYFVTGNSWWVPEPKVIGNSKFLDYENWEKVECLVNGYGIADSTSIIDDSGKNITVGGNTKIDVTSNLSSIVFDGNGDYLFVGNGSDFNFLHNGTQNWTVDFWFKPDVVANDGIFDTCEGSSSYYGISCYFHGSNGKLVLMITRATGSPSSGYLSGEFNYVFTAGTLYHVAITLDWSLSTDNAKLFVNGTQQASITKQAYDPSPYNSRAELMVGGFGTAYPTYMFQGKIYSFRVSRFLRYSSNFTVDSTRPYFPSKPKVQNWANTSLLINAIGLEANSTDIRDQKGNAVSVYGDAKIAVDSNGLSYINFDGSGDYLSTPQNADLYSLGTSDFTMEVIFSVGSLGAERGLIASYSSWSSILAFYLVVNSTGTVRFYAGNSIPINLVTVTALNISDLYHVAVSRVSGITSIYINGINSASTSNAATITNTSEVRIGTSFGGELFNGKIYSCRITKGKALYTSNFYVDLTNPYFPAVDSISDLWLDANDYSKLTLATGVSQISDKSYNDRHATQGTTTAQPALVQNAQNGLMALNFDGTDDYLTLGTALGKPSSWFVLAVCKFDVITGSRAVLCSTDSVGSAVNTSVCLCIYTGYANKLFYQFGNGSVASYGYTNDDAPNNVFSLISQEFVSGENYTRYYVDGGGIEPVTKSSTAATSTSAGTVYAFSIGRLGEYNGNYLDGSVCEIYLIKSNISDFLKNTIHGYAAHKWGLTDNLPTNHPYKNNAPTEDYRTDDYWYSTVLCINASDIKKPSDIFDSRSMNKVVVYGDTKALVDSNNRAYINFDGTGDYITVNSSFGLSSSNWTIEFFAEITSYSSSVSYSTIILDNYLGAAGWQIFIDFTGKLKMYVSGVGVLSGSCDIITGELHHYAIVRYGNTLYFYRDGVLGTSCSISATISCSGLASIFYGNSVYTTGKIYGFEITKQIARYTSGFGANLSTPYFPKKPKIDIDLSPDAWFDSSDLSTIVLDSGGRISQWKDKSGNNYHANQTIGANRPVISSDFIKGNKSIYFDGSSRFLTLGTVLGTTKPSNFSVFVVGRFIGTSSATVMCGSGDSGGQSSLYWGNIQTARIANDGKIEYSIGNGSTYAYGRTTNSVISTNIWFSGGWTYSGGNKPKWYKDGLEVPVTYETGSATTCGGTAYSFSLGRAGEYNGQYLNGNICEALIFKRALTQQEILAANNYFKNKWGV